MEKKSQIKLTPSVDKRFSLIRILIKLHPPKVMRVVVFETIYQGRPLRVHKYTIVSSCQMES